MHWRGRSVPRPSASASGADPSDEQVAKIRSDLNGEINRAKRLFTPRQPKARLQTQPTAAS